MKQEMKVGRTARSTMSSFQHSTSSIPRPSTRRVFGWSIDTEQRKL